MSKKASTLSVEQLENFFFEAALRGFAHASYTGIHHEGASTGHKEYRHHRDGLHYREVVHYDNHTYTLSGIVAITDNVFPVFHLSYGGLLPDRYLAYYKESLREAYEKTLFVGGRGPNLRMTDFPAVYSNKVFDLIEAELTNSAKPPQPEHRFRHFAGLEQIADDTGDLWAGCISYSGTELISFAGRD